MLSVYIFIVVNIRQLNGDSQDLWAIVWSSIPIRGVLGFNPFGPECLFLHSVSIWLTTIYGTTIWLSRKYSLTRERTREAETVLGPNSRRFPFSIITFFATHELWHFYTRIVAKCADTLLAASSGLFYNYNISPAEIVLWTPLWSVLSLWKARHNTRVYIRCAAKHWLRIIVFSSVFGSGYNFIISFQGGQQTEQISVGAKLLRE